MKFIMCVMAVTVLLIVLLLSICQTNYEKCYLEREKEGYAVFNMCGGYVGGTSTTGYLSESCIGCPYLSKKCNKEK